MYRISCTRRTQEWWLWGQANANHQPEDGCWAEHRHPPTDLRQNASTNQDHSYTYIAMFTAMIQQRSLSALTWYWTVSCIAPRWTGMCGALATRPPSGPNNAHEKSRRSLMFVEIEVLWRTLRKNDSVSNAVQDVLQYSWMVLWTSHLPICSAMLMKRCEKIESWIASSWVPTTFCDAELTSISMSPRSVMTAVQFGSTRIVLKWKRKTNNYYTCTCTSCTWILSFYRHLVFILWMDSTSSCR